MRLWRQKAGTQKQESLYSTKFTGRSMEIDTGSNGYNSCDNSSVYGALFCNRSYMKVTI